MEKFDPGRFIGQDNYKSFQPNLIDRVWHIYDAEVITLLSQADRHLGRLDMFSNYVPNLELFISMHVLKEATKSSKIEGTQTNIDDALLEVSEISPEKRDDWNEVQNYIEAMKKAIQSLTNLPLSNRLIKLTHNYCKV